MNTPKAQQLHVKRRTVLKNARKDKQEVIDLLEKSAEYMMDCFSLPMCERYGVCFAIAQMDTDEGYRILEDRPFQKTRRWMRDLFCEGTEHFFWWDDPTRCHSRKESDKTIEHRIFGLLFAIEYLKGVNSEQYLRWKFHQLRTVAP